MGAQKKVKRRYNPYRDPNFDPNSSQFDNYERKNSMFSKSEIQNFDKNLKNKSGKGASMS